MLICSLRKQPTFCYVAQEFRTDDVLLTRSRQCFWLAEANFQSKSSVWNFCARFPDVISRGAIGGVAKCRLFSQASWFVACLALDWNRSIWLSICRRRLERNRTFASLFGYSSLTSLTYWDNFSDTESSSLDTPNSPFSCVFAGASSINSLSSMKAFLFSLRSFYLNLSTTRLDIKPLHRHLAVTLDSYNRLSFGINDLTVNLDNRSIVSDVGNVYQVPSASEPDKFFTGESHFQADGLEVLVLEGELFLALSSCSLTAAWLTQLRERRSAVCWAGGHGFDPRPGQHSGSLNKWEESAAFVMTSANG